MYQKHGKVVLHIINQYKLTCLIVNQQEYHLEK